MSLTVLQRDSLDRIIGEIRRRIEHLEALLQGEPVGTARIADAAITNAKIENVSADKITTGSLGVTVAITIRNEADTADAVIIGYQDGGF